jgi:serine/threonine protein kinase
VCCWFVQFDVKPQNILIDADGHARLADFSLSKPMEVSDGNQATMARYSTNIGCVGTPGYP